ncbi:MAG: PqiC family protein [Pseudomonadales bacterium]
MTRACIAALAWAAIAGCAGSAPVPVSYYLLDPGATQAQRVVEHAQRPILGLERVDLAAYLKQPGMVLQTGDHQVQLSRTHLWAESLDLALPKALVRALQARTDAYSCVLGGGDWAGPADLRLRVRIDSLQANDRGEVVAAGRYQLLAADRPPRLADFRFSRDLTEDGHAHAVARMRELLDDIAAAILDAAGSGS